MKKIVVALVCMVSYLQSEAQQWQQIPTGTTNNFYGSWFHPAFPDTGFITGFYVQAFDLIPFVYNTDNGGANFNYQNLYNVSSILATRSVWFTDEQTGYIAGGGILKTTDGGINWNIQMSVFDVSGELYDMFFKSADTGFAVGETWSGPSGSYEGMLYRTYNGGNTWTYKSISLDMNFEATSISSVINPSGNILYAGATGAAGFYNSLFRSTNNGSTWTTLNYLESINSLTYVAADTLFAGTDSGIVRITGNGTVFNTVLSTPAIVTCVRMKNDFGLAVCSDGSIYKTTDRGNSWQSMTSPVTATILHHIDLHSDRLAFVVGNGGTLLKYTDTTTAPPSTDSVWAGDADGDLSVNVYDPLAIAVAYGETGPSRPGASTSWQPQYCAPWVNSFNSGINMKHSDCNGDGTTDSADIAAVTSNYGMVHLKPGGPKAKVTGIPDLYFDLSGLNFIPGAAISIPIKLGTATSIMNNIYGLATTITISGISLPSSPSITYPASWLGNNANTLRFERAGVGSLDWAYSRRDHQNNSGQGTFAHLNFTIPANAVDGQQIILQFNATRIIDMDGTPVTAFNELDDTVVIHITGIATPEGPIADANIIPNPSTAGAVLAINAEMDGEFNIEIADIAGKIVGRQSVRVKKGSNIVSLPAEKVEAGIYIVRIYGDRNRPPLAIKWLKN